MNEKNLTVHFKRRIFIMFFFISFITVKTYGQYFHVEKKNINSGLSQNDVRCIFQDNSGFIYFGTNNGLNKYDGYKNQRISLNGHINFSNEINQIEEDNTQNLWLSTSKGIAIYKKGNNKIVPLHKNMELGNFFFKKTMCYLKKDSKGNIWCMSEKSHRIYKISYDSKKFVIKNIIQINSLNKYNIFQCKLVNDILYLIAKRGFITYNINSKKINTFSVRKNILYFDIISKNHFLFSNEKGIYLYNSINKKAIFLLQTDFKPRIIHYKNEVYLISNKNIKYGKLDKTFSKLTNISTIESYNNFSVECQFIDRNGTLWVGFMREGYHKINQILNHFKTYNNFGNNHIQSLYNNGKTLLIGTERTGLYVLDSLNAIPKKAPFIQERKVFCIVYDKKRDQYLASTNHNGIVRFQLDSSNKKKPFILLPEIISSIKTPRDLLIQDNDLWIGTGNYGLIKYNLLTKNITRFKETKFPTYGIVSLMLDSKKRLWLSTTEGIVILEKDNTTITSNSFKKYLPNNSTIVSLESTDGSYWIGTLNNGLYHCLYRNDSLSIINHYLENKDGISDNSIKAILEDSNKNIWISNNRGLNRINLQNNTISSFSLDDGLQNLEFEKLTATKYTKDCFLFGGISGFNALNPSKIKIDTAKVTPILTEFLLFNKNIINNPDYNSIFSTLNNGEKHISLTYNQNNITIGFSVPYYKKNDKINYEYQLHGFDKELYKTDFRNRRITYTNLKPGKYILELRASNSDGIYSEKKLNLFITIHNPWWFTWPFFILYFIIVLILIYFIHHATIKKIKRNKYEIKLIVEKQQLKKTMAARTEFFNNVSHELRTPITLLLSPLEIIKENTKDILSLKEKHNLNIVFHNAEILHRLVDEILNFTKLERNKLTINKVPTYIEKICYNAYNQFLFWAQKKGIIMTFEKEDKHYFCSIDTNLMEQVLYNLLSNAIKHTNAGGNIKIKLESINLENKDYLKIHIIDNGQGISNNDLHNIFDAYYSKTSSKINPNGIGIGLYLTKSIIDKHNGKIDVKSKLGEGSDFMVTIPLISDFDKSIILDNIKIPNKEISKLSSNKKHITNKKNHEISLLIVDDNQDICNIIIDLFDNKYNIFSANNGIQALEIIKKEQPDIVLSDIMMPIMDGFTLLQKIKGNITTSHISVILLTAKNEQKDIIKAYKYKADLYCPKPFNNQQLTEMVNALLINKRQSAKKNLSELYSSSNNKGENVLKTISKADKNLLKKIQTFLEENYNDSNVNVMDLCKEVGLTRYFLNKKFKSLLGIPPLVYIRNFRLIKGSEFLKVNHYSVSEVTYMVGFNDLKYFRKCFKDYFGTTPQEYKDKYENN